MTDLRFSLHNWFGKRSLLWIRLLFIAGALFLSAALPLRASPRQMMLLTGLLLAVGGVLVFLRWPALGIITLVVNSLFVQSPSLPGGLNLAVLHLILLIGLWLAHMVVGQRQVRILVTPTTRPLLIFIVIAVLAFGGGKLPWFVATQHAPMDAQIGGLMIFILAIGSFLLMAHQMRDLRWLQWIVWVYIGLTSLHVAGWFVSGIGNVVGRLFQFGTVNNSMFWVWLVALSFSQALFNRDLKFRWRIVLMVVVTATVYVALIRNYGWKSGWIPVLAVLAAIIGFRSKKVALMIFLIGAVPAFYLASQAIATDQYSYSTRIEAWLIMLEIIRVNPILGFGPANYYWYTVLFPIRGYFIQFNSHNQYLDIIAQTGLLGLACFLWFAWEVGRLGWRLRNTVPDGFARAYVYGALGGLVGMLTASMLVDWVLPFVYNIGLRGFRMSMWAWLFLGGLASIEQIYASKANPT